MNRRSRQLLPILAIAVSLTVSICHQQSFAESTGSQLVDGVLVLKNGNILRGTVQQQGKRYHVHMPNGTLQVREQQVEMFCQSMEEAFQRRRESRGGSSADSHLELAGWCLRHELYGHAEDELQAAEAIDSSNRRVLQVRRQLTHVLQMDALKRKRQLEVATIPPKPKPIDQASLDKAPRWARALFVRQIQPLVVHSCATSGCHEVGDETNFQLNRLALDGAGHPDATLRNLSATLQQIDWQSADQSALLERAKQAHGQEGSSSPLPLHKLKVLEGWIQQLAEAHHKHQELNAQPLIVAAKTHKAQPSDQPNLPVQSSQPPAGNVRSASFESADPFDPAAFNNRYATAQKTVREQPANVPHVLTPSEPSLIPLPATE